MLARLFGKSPEKRAAASLYDDVVSLARHPAFYDRYGVPDTPEGRFEMISLHAALIQRRLKAAGEGAARLAQAFADAMIRDLDGALREMGVGDLTVPKKIRKLAAAHYDRLVAISTALDSGEAAVAEALEPFLTAADGDAKALARRLAAYAIRQDAHLAARPASRFLNGLAGFLAPDDMAQPDASAA